MYVAKQLHGLMHGQSMKFSLSVRHVYVPVLVPTKLEHFVKIFANLWRIRKHDWNVCLVAEPDLQFFNTFQLILLMIASILVCFDRRNQTKYKPTLSFRISCVFQSAKDEGMSVCCEIMNAHVWRRNNGEGWKWKWTVKIATRVETFEFKRGVFFRSTSKLEKLPSFS